MVPSEAKEKDRQRNPAEKMDEETKLEGQAEGILVMHRRIK
jgi:hypothetical protein